VDFLKAFEDYEHILLVAAAVWIYFKWQDLRKNAAEHQAKVTADLHLIIKADINEALSNGIGTKMSEIILAHEDREKANIEMLIRAHEDRWHERKASERYYVRDERKPNQKRRGD